MCHKDACFVEVEGGLGTASYRAVSPPTGAVSPSRCCASRWLLSRVPGPTEGVWVCQPQPLLRIALAPFRGRRVRGVCGVGGSAPAVAAHRGLPPAGGVERFTWRLAASPRVQGLRCRSRGGELLCSTALSADVTLPRSSPIATDR